MCTGHPLERGRAPAQCVLGTARAGARQKGDALGETAQRPSVDFWVIENRRANREPFERIFRTCSWKQQQKQHGLVALRAVAQKIALHN